MRVLVACERSGRVRDALLRRGHDAVSCDIEPSDAPGPHIVGPVERELQPGRWDMVIAFPPCRFLSASIGADAYEPWRMHRTFEAVLLFWALRQAAPRTAVENPRPHRLAGRLMGPRDGISEPYWFGDPWRKRTWWWLRGLQPLRPGEMVKPERPLVDSSRTSRSTGRPVTAGMVRDPVARALTPLGLAQAIADQWGDPAPQTLL